MDKQKRQHEQESRFIAFLKAYTESNNIQFEDVHNDFKTGIDVIIDGKPYDLKVSDSLKLSLFRTSELYNNETRCPFLEHPEIPYLYVVEQENQFVGFVINKANLITASFLNSTTFGNYSGDGNDNLTVDLEGQIGLLSDRIIIWKK